MVRLSVLFVVVKYLWNGKRSKSKLIHSNYSHGKVLIMPSKNYLHRQKLSLK